MKKKYDISDRLIDFAANVVFFCKGISDDFTGQYYKNQLLRSAGSAALNFGEAEGSITTKDFLHKISLCLKELKESRVNLKIMHKVNYGSEKDAVQLLAELEQLIKIIATIIKNKQ